MTTDISIDKAQIASYKVMNGDYPEAVPLSAVEKQNYGSPNHRNAVESPIPLDIVDVFATMDCNDAPTSSYRKEMTSPPAIIRLANLHQQSVNFVAASASNVYAITKEKKLLVSSTNFSSERDASSVFSSPNSLKDYNCHQVSCGFDHAIILATHKVTHEETVFATGANSEGQCGTGSTDNYISSFQPVKFIGCTPRIIQCECGTNFTLLLTDTCDVWAFGHNHKGQLGLPYSSSIVRRPTLVEGLRGLPIVNIAAGLGHSLALTSTGLVYASGRNDLGQLGTVSQNSTEEFVQVDSLADIFIVHIAAYQNYSAAIDEFGTIYLWGDQWGRTPRTIALGDTEQFVDIAVGNDGRFAALSSTKSLYTCGYYLSNGDQMENVVKLQYPQQPYFRVFSAGDYFLVLAGPNTPPLVGGSSQNALSLLPPERPLIKDRLRSPPKTLLLRSVHFPRFVVNQWAKEIVRSVFSSLGTINGSFMYDRYSEVNGIDTCGVDLELVCSVYEQFSNGVSAKLLHQLNDSFSHTLAEVYENPPPCRPVTMRFLVTALLHPSIDDFPGLDSYEFWGQLINVINKLKVKELLIQWISRFPKKYISRIIKSFNSYLSETTRHTGIYGMGARDTCKVIEIIWYASTRSQVIPYTEFYNEELCSRIEIDNEVKSYNQDNDEWCYIKNAPFILTAAKKTSFIQKRSRAIMAKFYIDACKSATQFENGRPVINPKDVYLTLKVKRNSILSSSIEALEKIKDPIDMQKQLNVIFDGEPGIDEGGVQREFFQLVVQKIVSPDLSLFKQTRDFYWFNEEIEDGLLEHVRFAGVIFGLAIYNGNLLNIRFPIALYKKLRGVMVTINDVEEFDPQLASTLQNILSYEGDVENDMCLTFDYCGHELIKNGCDIPVTNSNRKDYVEKVVDYVLNKSIEKPFNAFKDGFMSAAINLCMPLFRPEELSLLVAGEEELDFEALKNNTKYDGYTENSPTVKTFWKIVRNSLNIDEKRKLLYFVTSSPRAPIGGLGKVPFKIAKDGDKSHIPTSHTCFYMLVLPDNPDEEVMLRNLKIAIENSQGFQFK